MGLIRNFLRSLIKEQIEKDIVDIKVELKLQKEEIKELKKQVKKEDIKEENPIEEIHSIKSNVVKTKSAKEVVLESVSNFVPLLRALTEDSYDSDKWTGLIDSFNSIELNDLWKKTKGNSESMLRILAFWGLKSESCRSFVCTGSEEAMYDDENHKKLEIGSKYDVLSRCWLLTDSNGQKTVIAKGVARKCNN